MSWAFRSVQTDLRSEAPKSPSSFGQCLQPIKDTPVSVLTLDDFLTSTHRIRVFVMWSHASIVLDCGVSAENRRRAEVDTSPVAPPIDLVRWARKRNLIEVPTFGKEEEFREKVYSHLTSVNEKIREAGAYKSFWNIAYSGNTITSRLPKKEVDIQPIVHCLLSDQMLLSNIEVVPEYKTGEGDLDFLFMANVDGAGLKKICAEFKLAHSKDLEHGLKIQLPAYMNASQSTYGAYCVLDFKGNWFQEPALPDAKDIESFLIQIMLASKNPVHENIRNFVFHLAKPVTASKK